MRLYVAGPMTGLPEFNYPAFFRAAKELEAAGFDTINPARQEGREKCKTWLDFMRAGIRDVAACDGIALLDGWQDSRGAYLEAHIAESLGLPVRRVADWLVEPAAALPPDHAFDTAAEMKAANEALLRGGGVLP